MDVDFVRANSIYCGHDIDFSTQAMPEIHEQDGALLDPVSGIKLFDKWCTEIFCSRMWLVRMGSLLSKRVPLVSLRVSSIVMLFHNIRQTDSMVVVTERDPGCLEEQEEEDERDNDEPLGPEENANEEDISDLEDDDEPDEDAEGPATATLHDLTIAQQFIDAVKAAKLDNTKLDADVIKRLRNPIQSPLEIGDPDRLFSMKLFYVTARASQAIYNEVRETIVERHPDDPILSYEQAKKAVQDSSGVVSIKHDMCPASCLAYTGPYSDLKSCPKCGADRYDPIILQQSQGRKEVPLRQYYTIPVGPMLQAMFRTVGGSRNMDHFWESISRIVGNTDPQTGEVLVEDYDDFYTGSDIIDAVKNGDIKKDDILLMFSMDGAQLYKGKKSDCWIYIWVILNLSPDLRYKKRYVMPGGFIPGPNAPKDTDSFVFPGLEHLAALQKEGLKIWRASHNTIANSHPYLVFITADGVGLNYLNGLGGHKSVFGCRRFCGVPGRRNPTKKAYYVAHLKPDNYVLEGCDHPDLVLAELQSGSHAAYAEKLAFLIASPNMAQYGKRRKGRQCTSLGLGGSSRRCLEASRRACCCCSILSSRFI